MTGYTCYSCHKQFTHPAKQIVSLLSVQLTTPNLDVDATSSQSINATTATKNYAIEVYVCPFCQSKTYIEAPDGKVDLGNIASLIDCLPNETDSYLARGYKVLNADWQKNIRMYKPKTALHDGAGVQSVPSPAETLNCRNDEPQTHTQHPDNCNCGRCQIAHEAEAAKLREELKGFLKEPVP